MRRAGGLFLLVLGSAANAGEFAAPEGCETQFTVQLRGCVVSHHYTCTATPGDRWRAEFDEDGPFYVSRIDAEAQWLEATTLRTGIATRVELPARDAASVSRLLETGYDDYDFVEQGSDGQGLQIVGHDRLTGEAVTIDGEPLLRTEFAYRILSASGSELARVEGREFVSEQHRRFFGGERVVHGQQGDQLRNSTPVEFHYPGERGFLSTTPLHDCGAMMSGLPQAGDNA